LAERVKIRAEFFDVKNVKKLASTFSMAFVRHPLERCEEASVKVKTNPCRFRSAYEDRMIVQRAANYENYSTM